MDKIYDLTDIFDREMEILEADDNSIIYILDQKSERGNQCVIEQYHFERGERSVLGILDGTRLYESFRTYGAMKDYFYAVTVRSDYKLRLEEIDSHTWQPRQMFYLVPEGEILNIYPVHPDYLIVTDEAAATDELLMRFDDEDYTGKYYTLTYLYCLKTGEKWYLQDILNHMDVMDVQMVSTTDAGQLVLHLQELLPSGKVSDKLWIIQADAMITAMKEGRKPSFAIIEELPEGVLLTKIPIEGKDYAYRLENRNARRTDICELKMTDSAVKKIVMASVNWPEDGSVEYGADGSIYHVAERPDGQIGVTDLQKPERTFSYDPEYGDFNGIYMDKLAVTNFYHSEMVKGDLIFRECAAVHHLDDGSVEVFRGIAEQRSNYLVMLKSFLCL